MTDPDCEECGGTGQCDYAFGEDVRTMACEVCNDGGDEPDADRAYDEMKDRQAEEMTN